MKTRKLLLFWLLMPVLALVLGSCDKSSGSSGGSASVTPSVSVEEVSFDNDASSQIVTINLGKYKFYGAIVDDAGAGWCTVEILRAQGKVQINTTPNTGTTARECSVGIWVANTNDPDDEDGEWFTVSVRQEAVGGGGGGGSDTPSVTPNNLTFNYDASSQIVTINKGEYSHYGASLGDGAHGWCNVTVLENNQVEIRVSINSNTTPRQGTINCWVADSQYPSDDEKVILPVTVTQNVCDLQVDEATWMRFNFEMEADRTCTWSYDGGGQFTVSEMKYIWFREFQDMHVTQSNDTVTFWGSAATEGPNGDIYYYNNRYVWFMITGFSLPYDHCELCLVNYDYNGMGHNPDPNGNWQTDTIYAHVRMQHIPLYSYDLHLNPSSKTGELHFYYEGTDMDVLEGHYNSFARTKDDYFQEEDYVWVGRDRDEGEVEVHFTLK